MAPHPGWILMADNSAAFEQPNRRGLRGLFRRRQQMVIDGFHQGDVRAEEPLVISESGAIRGNIYAPEVAVYGAVKGGIVARHTVVHPGGQVWGDVNSMTLYVEPGGRLFGWYNAVDEDRYLLLTRGDTTGEALAEAADAEVPEFLMANEWPAPLAELATAESNIDSLRQLRAEAARHAMARAELEHRFDARVAEAAGEKTAAAARLRDELLVARGDLLALGDQLATAEAALADREQKVVLQDDELRDLREQLAGARTALAVALEGQEAALAVRDEAVTAREALAAELGAARTHAAQLAARLENLETALQGSLQRTAEQESALVRWQELAETSEGRVQELEVEVAEQRVTLAAAQPRIESLSGERQQLADELARTTAALREAQTILDDRSARLADAEARLEEALPELENLRQQVTDAPQVQEELRAALDNASARVVVLERWQDNARKKIQGYHERLLWAEASHATAATRLEEADEMTGRQQARLAALEEKLQQEAAQAVKWKANVDRTLEMMYAAEQRVKLLEDELLEARAAVRQLGDTDAALQATRARLAAAERDVERSMAALDEQGARLAELQATLGERDLALENIEARLGAAMAAQEAAETRAVTAENRLRQTREAVESWVARRGKPGA